MPGEAHGMDGHQVAEWLTVQAGDVTGTLQQGVRALLTRTNTLPPERSHSTQVADGWK